LPPAARFFFEKKKRGKKKLLEPVFTAETAEWPRDFSGRQGKFSQESLGLFQENLTPHAGKTPSQTVN
jgi:hypothetical protein